MTDREKLIELIIASGQVSGFARGLADFLIANGVTVGAAKSATATDLISRTAAHDLVRGLKKFAWTSPISTEHHTTVDVDDVQFGLDYLPTIEAEPVNHGRWEECDWVEFDGHGECIHYPKAALRCTNCCTAFKKELLWKRNHCPNCGAKMDGG